MEYTKFKEKVTEISLFYGFKFSKILNVNLSFSEFSYGYEIVLDERERSLSIFFLQDLSKELNTPYLSVLVWEDVISIIVYYK